MTEEKKSYDLSESDQHFLVYLMFHILEANGHVKITEEQIAEFKGVIANIAEGYDLKIVAEYQAGDLYLYRKLVDREA